MALYPRKIPGTHFCQRLSRSQDHSSAGMIRSIEKSNDLIGNRTRDLLSCSIVPQPATLSHVPTYILISMQLCHVFMSFKRMHRLNARDNYLYHIFIPYPVLPLTLRTLVPLQSHLFCSIIFPFLLSYLCSINTANVIVVQCLCKVWSEVCTLSNDASVPLN
jgi:hypothetical protein